MKEQRTPEARLARKPTSLLERIRHSHSRQVAVTTGLVQAASARVVDMVDAELDRRNRP